MRRRIFYFEGSDGGYEQWLELEADGSVTYSTSPNRYAAMSGAKGEFTRMSAVQAKKRWPQFGREIDDAIRRLRQA
jgi:hypothetical protein